MLIESVWSISPSLADFPSETLNCFPLTTINNILGASSVPEALRTPGHLYNAHKQKEKLQKTKQ